MSNNMRLIILSTILVGILSCTEAKTGRNRAGKLISLFNVITFDNSQCSTTNGLLGTCLTQGECTAQKGAANGNCASGFGVCCVFTVSACDSRVTQNCTYIQNEGFPAGKTTNEACTYTFGRPQGSGDICQIRLDFQNLVLQQPIADGVCTTRDTLVATGPTGTTPPPSNICGTLTGQHMYVDTGTSTTGDTGMVVITTRTATTGRTYNIKVNFIECNNPGRAPRGCLQYFTGTMGVISSYNHLGGQQLADQSYSHCIRAEMGFCSFNVRENAVTGGNDAFDLFDNGMANQVVTGLNCDQDNFISLPTSSAFGNLRCGDVLGSIAADTVPSAVTSLRGSANFVIDYFNKAAGNAATKGFRIMYDQVPC